MVERNSRDETLGARLLVWLRGLTAKPPTIDPERVALARASVDWLEQRIDFLDPGSTMHVPSDQMQMAARVRQVLTALEQS